MSIISFFYLPMCPSLAELIPSRPAGVTQRSRLGPNPLSSHMERIRTNNPIWADRDQKVAVET